ncbi:MAG: LysR family transcriptional regulator [Eubacteriales bacterium]
MELTQLRYFCAVAKNQHITQTANQLHIAQPALSQSIKRLEKELGAPLLEPKGRGIALTAAGQLLYQRLTPILDSLEHLPREIHALHAAEENTVRVNVLAASAVITESIIDFQQSCDHINFQIFQKSELEMCDIEVTTRLFYMANQKNCFVFTEQIFLAVPDTPAYRGRIAIDLSELTEAQFICLAGSTQFRAICDKFCAQAGFLPKVAFESDAPATVRNFIAAGLGVGFWPQISWGKPDTRDILLLPITAPLCQRDLIITCTNNVADSPSHNYFEFLKSYLSKLSCENN